MGEARLEGGDRVVVGVHRGRHRADADAQRFAGVGDARGTAIDLGHRGRRRFDVDLQVRREGRDRAELLCVQLDRADGVVDDRAKGTDLASESRDETARERNRRRIAARKPVQREIPLRGSIKEPLE